MRKIAIILALTAALLTACRSTQKVQPGLDPELLNQTKEEVFAKAEALFDSKKYQRSRTFYGHVYENYPNDPLGRRSLLRIADTYFHQGGPVNLVEAQYKYRDFINRYPGSEFADYAMLQIAMVSVQQMEKPDRDQAKTKEAVEKLREMIAAFPNSNHRPAAEEQLKKAIDRLAKHEHVVARYYIRRGNFDAAIARLNGLVDNYPDYTDRSAMFYDLATALDSAGRKGEARLYYERVMAEFPDSSYASQAKRKMGGPAA